MNKIRNLCIVNEFPPRRNCGGVQTVNLILKNKFEQIGYNVYSFSTEATTETLQYEFILPNKEIVNSTENRQFLSTKIRELNIDVILYQGYTEELLQLCSKAKKETGVKLIYSYHRNPKANIKEYDDYKEKIIQREKNWLQRILKIFLLELKRFVYVNKCRKAYRKELLSYPIENIDRIITLDKHYTDYMKSLVPVRHHYKFLTILNPIELTQQEQDYNKQKQVLFIARQTYQKRLDRLLYIWKDIYSDFNDWELVIVGDGEYLQEYKKIAENIKLQNVTFAGSQPAINYYKSSSIICMTSSHEGLPMTLIEAQVFGCIPVAYNSFSSLREIIIHKHNGMLIKPYRKKKFTETLKELMSNEETRDRISCNCKEFVSRFDVNNIIKEWISLLDQL